MRSTTEKDREILAAVQRVTLASIGTSINGSFSDGGSGSGS